MPTDTQRNIMDHHHNFASDPEVQQPDEWLSLRDILTMIFRHWRAIVAFVLLTTLASAIFFITRPKQFEAEGYLQVIPTVSQEGRSNIEILIVSHLQKATSAHMSKNISAILHNREIQVSPLEIEKKINITRPPKTDLIRILAKDTSADGAVLIAELWIQEYLRSLQESNIQASLANSRLLLNQAQSELMEKQATAQTLRTQVSKTSPVITLSRAVDDRQIWSALTQKTATDPESLKKLSEIHFKGQEQSYEYINLKTELLKIEQALTVLRARRDLYQEVVLLLEIKTRARDADGSMKVVAEDKKSPSEAENYVNTLLKRTDVIRFGEPGLISTGSGGIKKTVLVFLVSLVLVSFCAFIYEWWTGSGQREIKG